MFIGGEIKRNVVPAISKFAAAKQKCATEQSDAGKDEERSDEKAPKGVGE